MSNALELEHGDWELRLGEPRRRVNHWYACARCGRERGVYLRPSWKKPTFCGRACKTAQQNAERVAPLPSGPDHYAWQGDAVSPAGGRHRAQRAYSAVECLECKARPAERHHRDGNTANNTAGNIAILCRRCHMAADGRLADAADKMRAIQPLGVAARHRR